ncbi:NAD(P)/FAD-dependent oxidoreductase [Chloroflexota bacterium]
MGLISRRETAHYLRQFIASLSAMGKITSYGDFRGVPLKTIRKSYVERMLVVGDAAGQVKPTIGGGIYYGLLCADIAANVLKTALDKDDLSTWRMSRYQREWMKTLGRELNIGYYARKIFEGLSDKRFDRIFEIIKRNEVNKLVSQSSDISFDWHSKSIIRMLRSLGFQLAPLSVQLLRRR